MLSLFREWMLGCYYNKTSDTKNSCDAFQSLGREGQKRFIRYGIQKIRQCVLFDQGCETLVHAVDEEKDFLKKFKNFVSIDTAEWFRQEFERMGNELDRNANAKVLFMDTSYQLFSPLKRSMMRTVMILSLVTLLFNACSDAILVQMNADAPAEGWPRTWVPSFDFDVTDTLEAYNTFIDVRHTGDYPYSNLYLFLKLEHEGTLISIDTVECPLAAPDGKWYGKGLGFIHEERFDTHILYQLNSKFPKLGKYTMTLEQGMRRETLEGVLNVGISVEIVDP